MKFSSLELLKQMRDKSASTMFLIVDAPPMLEVNGLIQPANDKKLMADDTEALVRELMNDFQWEKFKKEHNIEFSYDVPDLARYRVSVFRQSGCIGAALRFIPPTIPTLKQLNLPSTLAEFARLNKGLVVITGPSGAGKSSTLAALVSLINKERRVHVVTVEDPIEFFYLNEKAMITQREVGKDTYSFANALRHCLRQDPDVIVVGEMRDLETISVAITAAETGHLVLATMHTSDSVQTIERIVDAFPPFQQRQIRVQLSQALEGVIAQRLVPRSDGMGRVPAVEILRVTPAVRGLIRQGKTSQLTLMLEIGARQKMRTFEQSFAVLYSKGIISADEVLSQESRQKGLLELIKSQRTDQIRARKSSAFTSSSRVLSIRKDITRYRAPLRPGDESRWGSSGAIVITEEGLQYTYRPLARAVKEFISDYSILTGYRGTFNLPENILITYKVVSLRETGDKEEVGLSMELFSGEHTFRLPRADGKEQKIKLNYDGNWHSLVIHVPKYLQGRPVKIYLIELSGPILKFTLRDLVFF